MNPTEALALLTLVVGVPLNVYVALRQQRLARSSANPVLRERLIVSVGVLLLTVVFGLIFVNNDTLPPPLDVAATKVITRVMVLVLAVVPALYWLGLYRRRALP